MLSHGGSSGSERSLDQPFLDLLGTRHFFEIAGINCHDDMKASVADMADNRTG